MSKLVISLPEEALSAIRAVANIKEPYNSTLDDVVYNAILNGTPLSKELFTCIIDRISKERYIPTSLLEEKRKQCISGSEEITDYTNGVLMGIALVSDIIDRYIKGEEKENADSD